MTELLVVVASLAISVAVIPLMIRVAPRIGMVDQPDPRKVHAHPVPRVGGIGIALGALAVILIAVPQAGAPGWLGYYLAGALLLIAFGALDDALELGHYVKFLGQFLAVIPLVWFGGVWVSQVPFINVLLPEAIGKPFTAFAIVGVINAVNHSDGLDGLAAGETLLSLGCIAYLARLAGDTALVLACFAVLGGLFGFLRFNTHPARVFMGDAGSQFLGFSLAAFAVVLTHQSNTSLSMALPLLILGLPLADILAVLYLRVSGGLHWFRATRNHVHHRLLGLGFDHYQAVVVIYALQTFFVIAALVVRHESDLLVTALYVLPCALVFGALRRAERAGWRARRDAGDSRLWRLLGGDHATGVARWLVVAVTVTVPAYFIAGGVAVRALPAGTTPALIGIAGLLAACLVLPRRSWTSVVERLCVFSLAPLWVYGVERQLQATAPDLLASTVPFYGALAVAVALVWKLSRDEAFAPNTMDFLVAAAAVGAAFFGTSLAQGAALAPLLIKVVVLLYACELIYTRASEHARTLFMLGTFASAALALFGAQA
jgi:UDP-GlcNAc:undecaprenyl-phosphate GlcNAc-1-phosphate transferase